MPLARPQVQPQGVLRLSNWGLIIVVESFGSRTSIPFQPVVMKTSGCLTRTLRQFLRLGARLTPVTAPWTISDWLLTR